MTKRMTSWALAAAFLASGLIALPAYASKVAPAKEPGVLRVGGNADAKLFTAEGILRAQSAMSGAQFDHGLTMTIDLYAKPPEGKTVPADEAGRAKFFRDWAMERAGADKARGIFVLICRSPGYVEVLADQTTRDRGFTHENEKKLRDTLLNAFHTAKDKPDAEQLQIRDQALNEAVGFVISDLKSTTVANTTTSSGGKTADPAKQGGRSVGGWICIGLCVLLGVWLVIGLIRALTSGGGGPGGGGGFGTALLGGLFGAMAGMWLYNSMFGSGGWFGGNDASAGDGGASGDAGTSGDGDFSGDPGAGGSFDGGGGGGDWGGGGDF